MMDDPIKRLNDEELEQVLDHAVKTGEPKLLKKTLDELERRGNPIEL